MHYPFISVMAVQHQQVVLGVSVLWMLEFDVEVDIALLLDKQFWCCSRQRRSWSDAQLGYSMQSVASVEIE